MTIKSIFLYFNWLINMLSIARYKRLWLLSIAAIEIFNPLFNIVRYFPSLVTLTHPNTAYFKRISDRQRERVSFRLGRGGNPHILRCTNVRTTIPAYPAASSRAIELELKPYPFYTTEERTAITPRTNRRVALFNSKANKKLADRGRIRRGKGKKRK